MRAAKPQATLSIRVQPRASKNSVVGWSGETLKITVTAPPVKEAANAGCIAFLADLLDIPPSRLALVRGVRSRMKVVCILGLSQDEVYGRLNTLLSSLGGEEKEHIP